MMTCAYYRRTADGTLWALRVDGNRIVHAVGPVNAAEMDSPPMARRSATPTDTTGWTLVDFECVSDQWALSRRTPMNADAMQRAYAGEPRLVQQDDGAFEISLARK